MNYLIEAFEIALTPINFLTIVLSVFAGLVVGIVPGLTATMAVALLTGLTVRFSPEIAVISLIGVYVGCISGGCQAAVLLNIPGTPSSAATAMDGYALNRQGKAGLAIFLATAASMIGTLISVVFVLFLTPPLSRLGLSFQSYEFFLLALFGILICGNLSSGGNALKGWIAGLFGLIIAMVGLDGISAYPRFSFETNNLRAGLPLVPLMIAIFGFPEIIKIFGKQTEQAPNTTKFKMGEGLRILGKNAPTALRGGILGTFIGIIPGVGEDVGGWLSYWSTKTVSKDKSKFGKGAYDGIIASESGSNACVGGALIPVLSLAIPGSTSAAIMLAAFFMHGYRPGPLLMGENPGFVYQVSVFLLFSSIIMFIIALFISRLTVKILKVNKKILMPLVFVFCTIGAYLVRFSFFDMQVMFIFGFVGFLLFYAKFPAAPLLLGMVLGEIAESNLIRALRLSRGSLTPFFTRPISLIFAVVICLLILTQFSWFRKMFVRKTKEDAA